MKRWIFNILIMFFALVFLISAYLLVDYYLDSNQQKSAFNALAQIMENASQRLPAQIPDAPTNPEAPSWEPAEPELVNVTDPDTGEVIQILPQFVELFEMNSDLVGWIQIEDTMINYPVMQKPQHTDYYLHRSYEKEYSRHGCIYVREVCDVFTPSDNLTIYGHRMGDGTMFNDLHKYLEQSFYEEHPYIHFNTLTEEHTYQIMAVFSIESSAAQPFQYHLFVDAAREAEFDEYVQNCLTRSHYDTGVTASYGDKLITLSTCEYTHNNGRLVVVAKRIS